MMNTSVSTLRRSFQLASLGLGYVDASPLVGWIVCSGQLIDGEYWLTGKSFADAFAKSMERHSGSNLTLYINTDPLYIKEFNLLEKNQLQKFKTIVLPNASKRLIAFGAKHHISIIAHQELESEAKDLNKRYLTANTLNRPYIVLKWAQTEDGFIARKDYDSKWISSPLARKMVHQWRSQEQGIMVGTNTCHYDNPKLNVRDWSGRDPIRIILDRNLRLGQGLHVFDRSQPTICYNEHQESAEQNMTYARIHQQQNFTNYLQEIMTDLVQRNIYSVFVEGGAQLLRLLIKQGWWDEARVFVASTNFDEGIDAPSIPQHFFDREEWVGENRLYHYQNTNKK